MKTRPPTRLRALVAAAALGVSACGALAEGAMRDRIQSAPTSPNPVGAGSLQTTPIATGKNGSMYRIIGADENEVCINGEVPGTPDDVANVTFLLRRFESPDDDIALVPTVVSKSVRTLGTADRLGPQGERLVATQFQACFDNHEHILTPQTRYLVVHPDVVLGPSVAAAWHFDDQIRGFGPPAVAPRPPG